MGHNRQSRDTFKTFNSGLEVNPFPKYAPPIWKSVLEIDPDKSYDSFRNNF